MNDQPKFDELMLAMDAVDTIRHETSILEKELSGDERKQAIKLRLREYYASQGVEGITEELLDRAVADMDKNRFVHEGLQSGLGKIVATAYVRRWKYARNGLIAAIFVVGGIFGFSTAYQHLVVKPQELALIERNNQLTTLLPAALKQAHSDALEAAAAYGDQTAKTVADNQKDSVEKYISGGLVQEAKNGIEGLKSLTKVLHAKTAVKALEERSNADQQTVADRINSNVLPDELKSVREAAGLFLAKMDDAAAQGDDARYRAVKRDLDVYLKRVETPMKLRIVDRSGVRSGVWRSQNGGQTKVFYIVVEALDPSGKAVDMPIRSIETGRTDVVNYWGIRVPESEYNRVGKDKADGIIDIPNVGTKPAGSLKFAWTIPEINDQTITRW